MLVNFSTEVRIAVDGFVGGASDSDQSRKDYILLFVDGRTPMVYICGPCGVFIFHASNNVYHKTYVSSTIHTSKKRNDEDVSRRGLREKKKKPR